jgi:hypothetical protein
MVASYAPTGMSAIGNRCFQRERPQLGACRLSAFSPDSCRSGFRLVALADVSGTAEGGGERSGSFAVGHAVSGPISMLWADTQ